MQTAWKLAYIASQSTMQEQIIYIQPEAPQKPVIGAPCNGCGICCLAEPCPLGVLLFRRKSGACLALRWSDANGNYRCGVLADTVVVLQQGLPWMPVRLARWLSPWVAPLLARLAHRWIAAGMGCDSSLQAQSSQTMAGMPNNTSSTPKP